jgi:hypothetical protein
MEVLYQLSYVGTAQDPTVIGVDRSIIRPRKKDGERPCDPHGKDGSPIPPIDDAGDGATVPSSPSAPSRVRACPRAHARATKATEWLVPAENPAGTVYGMIVVGALLAAESGRYESHADAVGSTLIALGLYWLAHAYASVLGRRLATHEHLTAGTLGRALLHDWAIVRGAAIPLLALLLGWAVGAGREAAVNAALWSTVAGLIAFELLAGVRSQATRPELALEVCVGVTIGVGILALKILLH